MVKNNIARLSKLNACRTGYLQEYKANTGRKVFGYFCSHTPEEIIHAAGILPVRILGNDESSERAGSVLQTYFCPFIRNCLAMFLDCRYKFLDGIIVPHTCDTVRGAFGIIKENIPFDFSAFIRLPISPHIKGADRLIREEYEILRRGIESYTGEEITEVHLRESIAVYNANRRLLQRLSRYRSGTERKLTGAEFLEICLAGFSLDRKEHNKIMEGLLDEMEGLQTLAPARIKILIAGNVLDNPSLVRLIEDLGAAVVCDDLCTGARYFRELVDEDTPDPMQAIVDNYSRRTICPCKSEVETRAGHLLRLYRESGAGGIIMLQQKFCDPHLWDYPLIKRQMDELGIPLQMVEFEQPVGNLDTMKNRIEAFFEMIRVIN